MSSRLRLQKNTAARKKAEQQALLEDQKRGEKELFESLQGTASGTTVVVAGRPPDHISDDEAPSVSTSAPTAVHAASRGQKQTKQILLSDSDSEGATDRSAGATSVFSASEESQQGDSCASSMGDSDEESPPPAKRGKKSVPSIAKASGRKTKAQAPASGPRIANKAATSKAAEAKRACSTVKSSSKQQAACISARKTPSSSPVVEETLPIKAQRAAGTAAAETAQSAAAATTVESAEQPASALMAREDHQKPSTSIAPKEPTDTKPNVAPSVGQRGSHSNMLPKHMTKGIQINSPGPAYKAPGLKRPQGGKPLHQIQPRT